MDPRRTSQAVTHARTWAADRPHWAVSALAVGALVSAVGLFHPHPGNLAHAGALAALTPILWGMLHHAHSDHRARSVYMLAASAVTLLHPEVGLALWGYLSALGYLFKHTTRKEPPTHDHHPRSAP